MPYLHVQTNIRVEDKDAFLQRCSTLVAEALGKPERYVMVALADEQPMLFVGSDAPVAFVQLKSLGLTAAQTAGLSAAICALLDEKLGIAKERVYIEFAAPERAMFGWNGGTF